MGCQIIDALAPQPEDLVLLKTDSGGFMTSSLDSNLRNLGGRSVFYAGVATSAYVLSTALAGFDLGYHGYVISDAPATFSQRLQDATEEILGGFMAAVVSTDEALRYFDVVVAVA